VNDRIVHYRIRISDQKQKAVHALKSLNYNVIAAGDSYNDTAMLKEANVGFLFRAPENVRREFAQFTAIETYKELYQLIQQAL
jgi:phosphoserine/homoserine phosphotransferase